VGIAFSLACHRIDPGTIFSLTDVVCAAPHTSPPIFLRSTIHPPGHEEDAAFALRVEDVALNGYAVDRATVRQKKTGRPVRFELTEQARLALDDYIRAAGKKPGEFLFTGRRGRDGA